MDEAFFVSNSIYEELKKMGLKKEKDIVPFKIETVDGVLVPRKKIEELIKREGIILSKATTVYEDIYAVAGYTIPKSGGISEAVVTPPVEVFDEGQRTDPSLVEKMNDAIQALSAVRDCLAGA